MKTAGIIAEYNPFHKGHEYQFHYIRETLRADYILVVMSGDFVQRGAPALLEKHARAEMALRCGADVVLELPVCASSASAEGFAMGGISLLEQLGVTDFLCFGAEEDDPRLFALAARILVSEPQAYAEQLRRSLKEGASFPSARCAALSPLLAEQSGRSLPEIHTFLNQPNNILGIEYAKAVLRLDSGIVLCPLKRKGAGYRQESVASGGFSSARALRNLIIPGEDTLSSVSEETLLSGNPVLSGVSQKNGRSENSVLSGATRENCLSGYPALSGVLQKNGRSGYPALSPASKEILAENMPSASLDILLRALEKGSFVTPKDLDPLLHYRLLCETREGLERYTDVSPALSARIKKQLNQYEGFSGFARLLQSRNFTEARIRRCLLHILLGLVPRPAVLPYARILGFRRSSREVLREIKKRSRIPLITKAADASSLLSGEALELFEESLRASLIYESILSRRTKEPFRHELEKPLVIVE